MSGQNWMRGRTVVYNPIPKPVAMPKRFRVGRIIWEALKRTAMLIGFVMLFSSLTGYWLAGRLAGTEKAPSLPDKMVLTLDMTGELNGKTKPSQYLKEFGFGTSSELTVPGMVDAIDAGAKDKRVQALSLFLGNAPLDIAELQELRAVILAVSFSCVTVLSLNSVSLAVFCISLIFSCKSLLPELSCINSFCNVVNSFLLTMFYPATSLLIIQAAINPTTKPITKKRIFSIL